DVPSVASVWLAPAASASGAAGTAAAVTLSAQPQAFRSLPHSGAVPAAPEPRISTSNSTATRMPPTIEPSWSSEPVTSFVCTRLAVGVQRGFSTSTASDSADGEASVPGVGSIFARTTALRVRSAICVLLYGLLFGRHKRLRGRRCVCLRDHGLGGHGRARRLDRLTVGVWHARLDQ